MADDDDVPALSADTFAALQEFYAEQAKRQEIFDKLQVEDKLKENVLFDENWEKDSSSENVPSTSNKDCIPNQVPATRNTKRRHRFWLEHGFTDEEAKARSQKPLTDFPEYMALVANGEGVIKRRKRKIKATAIASETPTKEANITNSPDNDTASVKVMLRDRKRAITTELIKNIEKEILRCIDTSNDFQPNFLQCTVQDGCLIITCKDNDTVDWLEEHIGSVKPWKKASLQLIKEHIDDSDALTGEGSSANEMAGKKKKSLSGSAKRRCYYWMGKGKSYEEARSLCLLPLCDVKDFEELQLQKGALGTEKSQARADKQTALTLQKGPRGTVNLDRSKPTFSKAKSVIKVNIFSEDGPMNTEQMNKLQDMIMQQVDNCKAGTGPRFFACKPHTSGLLMVCADEYSRKWLLVHVPCMKPWPNAVLKVGKEMKKNKSQIAFAWIQDSKVASKAILHRLAIQNSGIDFSSWRVVNTKSGKNGQLVTFSFNDSLCAPLMGRDCQLYFGLKSIHLKLKYPKLNDGKVKIVTPSLSHDDPPEVQQTTKNIISPASSIPPPPPPPSGIFYFQAELEPHGRNLSNSGKPSYEKPVCNPIGGHISRGGSNSGVAGSARDCSFISCEILNDGRGLPASYQEQGMNPFDRQHSRDNSISGSAVAVRDCSFTSSGTLNEGRGLPASYQAQSMNPFDRHNSRGNSISDVARSARDCSFDTSGTVIEGRSLSASHHDQGINPFDWHQSRGNSISGGARRARDCNYTAPSRALNEGRGQPASYEKSGPNAFGWNFSGGSNVTAFSGKARGQPTSYQQLGLNPSNRHIAMGSSITALAGRATSSSYTPGGTLSWERARPASSEEGSHSSIDWHISRGSRVSAAPDRAKSSTFGSDGALSRSRGQPASYEERELNRLDWHISRGDNRDSAVAKSCSYTPDGPFRGQRASTSRSKWDGIALPNEMTDRSGHIAFGIRASYRETARTRPSGSRAMDSYGARQEQY